MSPDDTRPAPPPGFAAVVRADALAVGLVSPLTDVSSERIGPLAPVFVAGLVLLRWWCSRWG